MQKLAMTLRSYKVKKKDKAGVNPQKLAENGYTNGFVLQELQRKKVQLDTKVYSAFLKACATSPSLVGHAHAALKRIIWGPRRMKPNVATFVTRSKKVREAVCMLPWVSTLACANCKQVSQLHTLLCPAVLMSPTSDS